MPLCLLYLSEYLNSWFFTLTIQGLDLRDHLTLLSLGVFAYDLKTQKWYSFSMEMNIYTLNIKTTVT